MKGIWEEILRQEVGAVRESETRELRVNQEQVLRMSLSEFVRRDMAIWIYSEVLGCDIWLCSHDVMELNIKKDYPEAVTYTVDEMRRLPKLNPTPEDLKGIHNAKSVFKESRIIKSLLKGEIVEVLK